MNKKFTAQFGQKSVLFLLLSLLLFLTAILMFPGNPMDNLPGRDNGVFLYGGQQILRKAFPILIFGITKVHLIHYINAFGLLLWKWFTLGSLGRGISIFIFCGMGNIPGCP